MPAFSWRAYTPAPGLEALDGTSLEWIDDHCADSKALLISQFRDKPRIEGISCALAAGVQDLHDAIWQVLTERWLLTAVGVQLDMLGTIVDLGRSGWTDGTYRQLLRAQVLVLRSKGTWPSLFPILEALGVTLSLTVVDEPGMAAMRIVLGEPMDGDVAAQDVFNFIERAKPAGVRFTLDFPVAPVANTFHWASGDVNEVDTARGWADDGETIGGLWAGAIASTETA